MITSLKKMLELTNFGQITISSIQLQYNLGYVIKFCCWRHEQNYDALTFFQNSFILRRPRVTIFADIIITITLFI